VKHKIALYFSSFILFGFLFAAADAAAQTIAYRQTNLSSNLPNVANNVTPGLANPWGIAFLSDQPFFIADNKVGRVTVHDASGLNVGPGGFIVPNATRTGFDTPTGIVADQNSFFGGLLLLKPFILVTDEGTDAQGNIPPAATLVVNNASTDAVYRCSNAELFVNRTGAGRHRFPRWIHRDVPSGILSRGASGFIY